MISPYAFVKDVKKRGKNQIQISLTIFYLLCFVLYIFLTVIIGMGEFSFKTQ
jgi:hypothetical protein